MTPNQWQLKLRKTAEITIAKQTKNKQGTTKYIQRFRKKKKGKFDVSKDKGLHER